MMEQQHAVCKDLSGEQTQLGMARFFSPENLDRYRRLAASPLGPESRRQILLALAAEMKAMQTEPNVSRSEQGSDRRPDDDTV
jgi:hypothetical protein